MSEIVGQPDNINTYLKDSMEEQRNLSYLLSCEVRIVSILTLMSYILFIFVSGAFCWNLVFNLTFSIAIATTSLYPG